MPTDKKLPYGLRVLPKGLTFASLAQVNEAGERGLLVMFPVGFDASVESVEAIRGTLSGEKGKLLISGSHERGAFYAQSAAFYSDLGADPVLEETFCPMVRHALQRYLKRGDPEQRFHVPGLGTITARRALDLLDAKDDRMLRYVQDIHDGAVRSIMQRTRQPSKAI